MHIIHELKVTNEAHLLGNTRNLILQATIQITQGNTFFNTPKYSIWNPKPLWLPTWPHTIANSISPIYIWQTFQQSSTYRFWGLFACRTKSSSKIFSGLSKSKSSSRAATISGSKSSRGPRKLKKQNTNIYISPTLHSYFPG